MNFEGFRIANLAHPCGGGVCYCDGFGVLWGGQQGGKFAGGSAVLAGATTGPSADPFNKGKSPLLEEDPPVRGKKHFGIKRGRQVRSPKVQHNPVGRFLCILFSLRFVSKVNDLLVWRTGVPVHGPVEPCWSRAAQRQLPRWLRGWKVPVVVLIVFDLDDFTSREDAKEKRQQDV
ncbi:hypothetical protein Tco_0700586 [Tanacetum coccineum]